MKTIIFLLILAVAALCIGITFDNSSDVENEYKIPEPRIIEKSELIVVGMQQKIQQKKTSEQVPKLWNKFMKRSSLIPNPVLNKIYLGVSFDMVYNKDINDYEYQQLVGSLVERKDDVPKGMIRRTIAAQKYLVFTHKGTLSNIQRTYDYIFSQWIPANAYSIAKADMFEWYDERFVPGDSRSKIDIYIPIDK
jgi:AraC family transcriptional regulator